MERSNDKPLVSCLFKDSVDRFIRAYLFPPHDPAAAAPDLCVVTSLPVSHYGQQL